MPYHASQSPYEIVYGKYMKCDRAMVYEANIEVLYGGLIRISDLDKNIFLSGVHPEYTFLAFHFYESIIHSI